MNILILVNDILYYTKMMVQEYKSILRAHKRNLKINNVELLCPGLNDWNYADKNIPIDELIYEKYGDKNFFNIITILPGNTFDLSFYKRSQNKNKKTALFMHMFEGRDYMSLTTFDHYWLDIAFYTSCNELYQDTLANFPSWKESVIAHYTQVGDVRCIENVNKDGNIKVLLTGSICSSDIYSFRKRLYTLLENNNIKDIHIRKHPGYLLEGISDEDIINKKIDFDLQDKQYEDYINQLKNSDIVICTSMKNGAQTTKYFEAALAGALIIGDIPSDEEDIFNEFVVKISDEQTDEEILNVINYWINNKEERIKRALTGQNIVKNKYTWDVYSNKLINCYNMWVNKKYGVIFSSFNLYENRCKTQKEIPKIEPWYSSYIYDYKNIKSE